jgi:ParB family chromosome partitioning protein
MRSIVSVNPFRCRVWELHDRLEGQITEETCKAEIESFSKHGQLIPALGRPLRNDPDFEVELIYGARRLFAARHINMPLKVELRELSDQEAIIAIDIENRQRLEVSPYERGISYTQWLREGYFKSQDDICRVLRLTPSRVSRLLKVARLPSVIVNAFQAPQDIREEWALELVDAFEDPQRRASTVQKARAIGATKTRPAARVIYQQLLSTASGRRPKPSKRDEVVKGRGGTPLFRIRQQTNSLLLLLPMGRMSRKTLEEIREALTGILENDGGVPHDSLWSSSVMDHTLSPAPAREHVSS